MAPSTEARRRSAQPPIPVRRLDLAMDPTSAPRDYYADDAHLTAVMNALSTFFPDGESFFVESVRHYRDQIEDPALTAEIAAFVGQEAMHSKEHELFNDMLEHQGLPTSARFGDRVARFLLARARSFPMSLQLAATCALEHFTAILAEQLLADDTHRENLRGPARELWLWHALEESEHKTVAYDVYEAVDGSYLRRVLVMVPVSAFFVAAATLTWFAMLKERGILSDVRGILRAQNYMWGSPGIFRKLIPGYLAYFRPGFHPTDHDSRALVEKWNTALFGPNGTMRDKVRQVRVPNAPLAASA